MNTRSPSTPLRSRLASLPASLSIVLSILAAGAVSGCSNFGFPGVYRINVEQGNIITQEMVDQLRPGMTRRQVRFVLGTPLIEDPFHPERWDYIYLLRNGQRTLAEQRLTVYFDGDVLTNFTSTLPPSDQAKVAAGKDAEAAGG